MTLGSPDSASKGRFCWCFVETNVKLCQTKRARLSVPKYETDPLALGQTKANEPRKKELITFHYIGSLIGILITVCYNPYING